MLKTTKITIELTEDLSYRLDKMARQTGLSKEDVVRDSFRVYEFIAQKLSDGYSFLACKDDDHLEDIEFFKDEVVDATVEDFLLD